MTLVAPESKMERLKGTIFLFWFLMMMMMKFASINCYTPVVMYHGMGDTANGSITSIKLLLEAELPGIYVTSIQMGDNWREDFMSGYFMNLNKQVEKACEIIKNDPKLQNGYNGLGFSQGGQIIRGIAERCGQPPMKNLISIGGQHQGVYGVPKCIGPTMTCNVVRHLVDLGAYISYVQDNVVQAEYWHDPYQEDIYKNCSVFLADINNEKVPRNPDYKANIVRLENLVLVMFLNDTIVVPRESGWFQFYEPGQDAKVYQLRDSPLYQEDWIGLKQLDEQGKLKLIDTEGDHLRFGKQWFKETILKPYLSK